MDSNDAAGKGVHDTVRNGCVYFCEQEIIIFV